MVMVEVICAEFLDTSAFGQQMFDYFPRGIRIKDKSEANDTLYRLCQIFGKPLDEIKERLDQFSAKRFDPNEVDAAFIPYIDNLLGWPTNFELSEGRRRYETGDAINVWKAKEPTMPLNLFYSGSQVGT